MFVLALLACLLGRDQLLCEGFSGLTSSWTRVREVGVGSPHRVPSSISPESKYRERILQAHPADAPFFESSSASGFGGMRRRISSSSRLMMSSVSVGGGGSPPGESKKPPVGFIISPSTQTGADEMLILRNMNQISAGANSKLGIIGTNDLGEGHKQMIEFLTYALVLSGNHIFTSGGGNGTNRAVISGALRACNADLLTVILPQSILKQAPEMQPLLMRVANLVQQPANDEMDFKEAAELCNEKIIKEVNRLLVFAYHDSRTVLKSAFSAEERNPPLEVIIFYLD